MPPALHRFGASFVLSLLALAATAPPSSAQTLEAPAIIVPNALWARQLATGRDGVVLAVGGESPLVVTAALADTAPFTRGGATLSDTDIATTSAAVTALPHGGFAAAWKEQRQVNASERILTQRLSPAGGPTGPAVPASVFDEAVGAGDPGVAAAGDGFVVAFNLAVDIVGQRYDATGTQLGARFVVEHDDLGVSGARVAAVPGGFLIAWSRGHEVHARLYAADATPLSAVFTVGRMQRIALAVNPAGTLAAVVGVPNTDDPNPNQMRVCFFTPDGSSIGEEQIVGPRQLALESPDVASDPNGNFLVVYAPDVHARAYDANGAPFGPLVILDAVGGTGNVTVAGRRNGGFLTMRQANVDNSRMALVTLCAPGSATCGDGTLVPTCEVCDDGAANSSSVPDACRPGCVHPTCGDGTIDSDEECDDGNLLDCDGCTGICELEAGTTCGDGIRGPLACGEACDDGNAIAGDGCTPACKMERIPGGGPGTTDCYAAWKIDNPSNEPRFDKRGINAKQTCRDNDPACDFDGGLVGSCTFHLAVCVNNTAASACEAARLQSWAIASPSAKVALARPSLGAVRAALEAAVVPTVVGSGDPNACSPNADVVVPLRPTSSGGFKANKLKLKSRATVYSGAVDTDGLQLRCEP
jgi:cysteine-rich repeat protein